MMFLLLAYVLRSMTYYWCRRRLTAAVFGFILFLGGESALLQHRYAIAFHGHPLPVTRLVERPKSYPNFGPDHSLFERFLRKSVREDCVR